MIREDMLARLIAQENRPATSSRCGRLSKDLGTGEPSGCWSSLA